MNRRHFAGCLLLAPVGLTAGAGVDDLLEAGREFIEENLDPDFVKALQNGDFKQAESLLSETVERLQGDYVLDLAALKETLPVALRLLEGRPESRAYGAWLRARVDYFDVADYFQDHLSREAPGGQPPPPVPTPDQERRVWKRQLENRPQPKGASSWVPRLKPIFHKAGSPSELVWLAEVESLFSPEARSPVGAAGLYQLMPKTALTLGLKLTPNDERLVPEKNARAAATYLRQLYRQFKDWRLVLAAYNAGPGRIANTLTRRRAASFDAIAPNLPAETQMYVPKVETVLQRREGLALTNLRLPIPA